MKNFISNLRLKVPGQSSVDTLWDAYHSTLGTSYATTFYWRPMFRGFIKPEFAAQYGAYLNSWVYFEYRINGSLIYTSSIQMNPLGSWIWDTGAPYIACIPGDVHQIRRKADYSYSTGYGRILMKAENWRYCPLIITYANGTSLNYYTLPRG